MARENSPFTDEGKYLLIEEFGKNYATYFSKPELLAKKVAHLKNKLLPKYQIDTMCLTLEDM